MAIQPDAVVITTRKGQTAEIIGHMIFGEVNHQARQTGPRSIEAIHRRVEMDLRHKSIRTSRKSRQTIRDRSVKMDVGSRIELKSRCVERTVETVIVDGTPVDGNVIPTAESGVHTVEVVMG